MRKILSRWLGQPSELPVLPETRTQMEPLSEEELNLGCGPEVGIDIPLAWPVGFESPLGPLAMTLPSVTDLMLPVPRMLPAVPEAFSVGGFHL